MKKRRRPVRKEEDELLPAQPKPRGKLKMVLQITIPLDALEALNDTGEWQGKLPAEISSPSNARIAEILKMQKKGRARQANMLPPKVKWIVKEWNKRCDPPPYSTPRRRNTQISNRQVNTCRTSLEQLAHLFDREEITELFNQYFGACLEGRHLWDDIDHRYKTLSGWCKAVLKARVMNTVCWWEPRPERAKTRKPPVNYIREKDDYPETTEMIANSFAQLILGKTKYGKANAKWLKFEQAAKRVEYALKYGVVNVSREVFIKMLVRCAQKQAEEMGIGRSKTVWPGHLCSDSFWGVVLPQFLAQQLPGTQLPPELMEDTKDS